jgi:long-chain acyl-CoA synthetase
LLSREPTLRLLALVRARDDDTVAARRRALRTGLPLRDATRLEVVRGDMTAPDLGLSPRDRDAVFGRVDRVIHCAASIRFDLPLDQARRENVASTAAVLDLCRRLRARGRSGRLDHVSTAFVAGTRLERVGEEELFVGQAFRNTYEQTKCEAEALCRDARNDIPVVIHRPSIVVGRQSTGETTSYKAAYGPMRVLIGAYNRCPSVLNRLVPLPLPPDLAIDLVPVDYVAGAIATLFARDEVAGRCYHLAAGPEGAARLRGLADLTCAHFGTPRIRFRPPGAVGQSLGRRVAPVLKAIAPKLAAVLDVTFAYGFGMPEFDTANARADGVAAPPVTEYFERILGFAFRNRFGRERVTGRPRDAEPGSSRRLISAAERSGDHLADEHGMQQIVAANRAILSR